MTTRRTKPMRRGSHEACMDLPAGRTCADCRHFERCAAMFGHIAADEVCDFAPSRFLQAIGDRPAREVA